MAILIDTQAIVWLATNDRRLSARAVDAMTGGTETIFVSAVTAYEFVDLNRRGRFGANLPFGIIVDRLAATILDYPVDCWRVAEGLPLLHHDPVDRMTIAHAIHADITLITADATMRSYPVRTLW